jgi:hypothetical protein
MWRKQAQTIFLTVKDKPLNIQKKTKEALYSIGKEGDFTRVDNTKVDTALESLADQDDISDTIGDIYRFVDLKLLRHQQIQTRRKKTSNKNTRRTRRKN